MLTKPGSSLPKPSLFAPATRRWATIPLGSVSWVGSTAKWRTGAHREITTQLINQLPHRALTFRPSPETSSKSKIGASREDDKRWEGEARYNQPHPIWQDHEVKAVERTHFVPQSVSDITALTLIKILRNAFDIASGYKFWPLSTQGWINRLIVLETVAGVPGLVGAGFRHLRSLRRMQPDYGWIHTLLEEAENERMHLMTVLVIKQPGKLFRAVVICGQVFFFPLFTTLYALSAKTAHRFVGYLEEEAVKTYTHLLHDLESGRLPDLSKMKAPKIGREYWQLHSNASFTDMIYAIRADESHHRDVNHTFANMRPDEENPFAPGH